MTMLVTLNEMKGHLGIATGVPYTAVDVDLTIVTGTLRITRATGNWATEDINVGDQLTLAGFVNAGNNILVTVASVISATVIQITSVVGMVDEVGPAGDTSYQKSGTTSDSTYDVFLTEQVTLISEAIEGYCGRIFAEDTYVQTFYQDELERQAVLPSELYLYHYPVVSVEAVTLGTPPTEDFTEYRVVGKSGKIVNPCGWYDNGDIEVEYTAGYDVIPTMIKHVVYNLVEERYNKKIAGVNLNFGSNVQRVSIPGTISLDFDYTLQANERVNAFGMYLGDYMNVLDSFRSERTLIGDIRNKYVE